MSNRDSWSSFGDNEWHKGFYNDNSFNESLFSIQYDDFFELPDDDEFPYGSAYLLLCGSCHIFADSLKKILGYTPYIIEQIDRKGFHAFCQVYRNGSICYVDARGITSSFDEFMEVAEQFVKGKYIIRPAEDADLNAAPSEDYYKEGSDFADAVIEKYKECYTL